jgi:hypothetical protein
MLAQLISHHHVPSLIIEETSAVADTERQKFLDRIAGFDVRGVAARICTAQLSHRNHASVKQTIDI